MAGETSLCIYNARLLDESLDTPGMLVISGHKICTVLQGIFNRMEAAQTAATLCGVPCTDVELVDASGYIVQPAFIDMHAHFRYPGQTMKEDLSSGLHAAAAGGYGTLVLMPNTQPVVSSVQEAARISKEAAAYGLADVFQTVSLTRNFDGNETSHLDEIQPYLPGLSAQEGAIPVATEDGRDVESAAVMLEAMRKCAAKNIIVSCHSEDVTLAAKARPLRSRALELLRKGDSESATQAYNLLSKANQILALAEDIATERNIELGTTVKCAIHIAHTSTASSIQAVRKAKAAGQRITCEVTPHHLALSVSERDPALRHLVNPPIRSEHNRQALLSALCDGTVDAIATDHAPHTTADKASGAPGFTGLETAYAICNTKLVQSGLMNASRLSYLMSANPARLLGLASGKSPKGRLLPGFVADLVICDDKREWTVDSSGFYSKGKYTPLEGKTLHGKIVRVFHQGKSVFPFTD